MWVKLVFLPFGKRILKRPAFTWNYFIKINFKKVCKNLGYPVPFKNIVLLYGLKKLDMTNYGQHLRNSMLSIN